MVLNGGHLEGRVYIPHPSKASCLSFCLSVVYTWFCLNWVYVLVPFHSSYTKSVLGAEAGGDVAPLTSAGCCRQGPVLMCLFSFRCLHFLLSPPSLHWPQLTASPQPFLTCQPPVGPPCLPPLSISLQLSSCQASHSMPPPLPCLRRRLCLCRRSSCLTLLGHRWPSMEITSLLPHSTH